MLASFLSVRCAGVSERLQHQLVLHNHYSGKEGTVARRHGCLPIVHQLLWPLWLWTWSGQHVFHSKSSRLLIAEIHDLVYEFQLIVIALSGQPPMDWCLVLVSVAHISWQGILWNASWMQFCSCGHSWSTAVVHKCAHNLNANLVFLFG